MQYATRAISTRDQAFVAKLRQSKDQRHLRLAERLDPHVTKPKGTTKAHADPEPPEPKPAQQPHGQPPQQQPGQQPGQQPHEQPPQQQPQEQEGGDHKVGGMGTQDFKSEPAAAPKKPTPTKGR
jgi:hypothetical protein